MKRVVEFQRYFPISEVRAEGEGETKRVAGYAAVFDSLSEPMWGFREVIRPGAFAKTLQESDVVALWNHDTSLPLGRRSNGALMVEEDAHGLRFALNLPDTSWGNDAYVSIQRGDIKEMSFGFSVVKERMTTGDANTETLRELLEVALYEISPVTFPAYRATEVEARARVMADLRSRAEIGKRIQAMAETTLEPAPARHSEAGSGKAGLLRRRVELALAELQ